MANIPKNQEALYPHIPKIDPSILYPFKYLQKYPVSLLVFGQYPCIPKNPSRASLVGGLELNLHGYNIGQWLSLHRRSPHYTVYTCA